MNESFYTWDDLYQLADGCGYGDAPLVAKDEARYQLGELITKITGHDIEKSECPEEDIESFLLEYGEVLFDVDGNIVGGPYEKG